MFTERLKKTIRKKSTSKGPAFITISKCLKGCHLKEGLNAWYKTSLMAESEEELKSLDESERGEWKSWLQTQHSANEDHGIWSHHFMVNRWGNNRNSDRLYFLRVQIIADGDCSHEIKRHLLLGRKAMTNLDSILKSRHITLSTKVRLVKAMVFPVAMYGCKSWTIKKDEH